MLLEILSEEEKRAFNLPDDSERAPAKGSEALTPKEEQADDDLTEEERKELDKGNDILHDCGCQSLRSHNSGRLVSDAPPKEDSTLSSQSKRREPFLPFQRITDWRFIEALPSGLLGEVYGRARTRLPYRAYRLAIFSTNSLHTEVDQRNSISLQTQVICKVDIIEGTSSYQQLFMVLISLRFPIRLGMIVYQ